MAIALIAFCRFWVLPSVGVFVRALPVVRIHDLPCRAQTFGQIWAIRCCKPSKNDAKQAPSEVAMTGKGRILLRTGS